jgi:hypothetical protein
MDGWVNERNREEAVVVEEEEEGREGSGSWTWRELTEQWSNLVTVNRGTIPRHHRLSTTG